MNNDLGELNVSYRLDEATAARKPVLRWRREDAAH
jgi:hypothetical protein